MIIVYESKTGFTKRYAELLAHKSGMKAYHIREFSKMSSSEDIIFLGWMKIGRVQGLDRVREFNIKAVCGSGTGRTAEPSEETIILRNKLDKVPFFYLRGGCLPLKELKGLDRFMMTMFLKTLKNRREKDERITEAIEIIENGYDGVKEENLIPVLEWLNSWN